MPPPRIRESTPTDSHETTVIRLPSILSAGGGEQWSATPLHEHPGDELVLIEQGPAVVQAGEHRLQGVSGSLFLLPKGCVHNQLNQPRTRSWFVVFRCRRRRFPRTPRLLHIDLDDPVATWFPELCRQHLASDGVPTAVSALLLAVFVRLAARDARSVADHVLPAPVCTAIRLFEQHPTEGLSATEVADAAGVSPLEHHLHVRLDLAAKLLRSSYLSVFQVATACGWQDANYFGRIFAKRFAASPRAWRTTHRV